MVTRRRDTYSSTVVRLPERELSKAVLEFPIPLLDGLGPSPTIHDAPAAVALAVTLWNASVLASKQWEHPRVNELKKRMRGRQASRDDAVLGLVRSVLNAP